MGKGKKMISIQDYRCYSGKQLFKLAVAELMLFVLAFILAVVTSSNWLVFNYIGINHNGYLVNVLFITVGYSMIACLSLYLLGLYKNYMNLYLQEQFLRGFAAVVVLLFILNNISYWFPKVDIGRYVWLSSIIYSYLFFIISRTVFAVNTKNKAIKNRTIVLGTGNKALQLKNSLDAVNISEPRYSVEKNSEIVGYVQKIGDRERIAREQILNISLNTSLNNKANQKTQSNTNAVLDYCLKNNINTIVVAVDDRRSNFPLAQLLECKQNGIAILELMEFYEQEFGLQKLDILDPSWVIYSNQSLQTKQQELNKMIIDFCLAMLGIIIMLPIFCLISILLKLNLGFKNKLFTKTNMIGKFNKIYQQYSFNVYNSNNQLCITGRLINEVYKLFKLDLKHLPALFNILKGNISFVGPAAITEQLSRELSSEIWYFKQRFALKPGIVSWGYGSNNFINIKQQLQYDLYYIKKRTCLLDFILLLSALLSRRSHGSHKTRQSELFANVAA
jgi:lipopolysaccharide/colanic/teichoic acid biosynthesis glycosyltransferase